MLPWRSQVRHCSFQDAQVRGHILVSTQGVRQLIYPTACMPRYCHRPGLPAVPRSAAVWHALGEERAPRAHPGRVQHLLEGSSLPACHRRPLAGMRHTCPRLEYHSRTHHMPIMYGAHACGSMKYTAASQASLRQHALQAACTAHTHVGAASAGGSAHRSSATLGLCMPPQLAQWLRLEAIWEPGSRIAGRRVTRWGAHGWMCRIYLCLSLGVLQPLFLLTTLLLCRQGVRCRAARVPCRHTLPQHLVCRVMQLLQCPFACHIDQAECDWLTCSKGKVDPGSSPNGNLVVKAVVASAPLAFVQIVLAWVSLGFQVGRACHPACHHACIH